MKKLILTCFYVAHYFVNAMIGFIFYGAIIFAMDIAIGASLEIAIHDACMISGVITVFTMISIVVEEILDGLPKLPKFLERQLYPRWM